MNQERLAFFSALALACVAGYGCSSEVNGSGSTGTGGAESTTTSTSTSTGVGTSVGGAGTSSGGMTSAQSSSATTTTTTTTTTSATSSTGTGNVMPGCTPKDGVVLAVTKFYYGDTNFDDTANKVNGWKQYGFNLDGKVSTAASVDLCKPQSGGSPNSAYPDGNNGNDNSFGRNILPIFMGISSGFSDAANQAITAGKHTVLLDLEGLGAAGDLTPLVGRVYGGSMLDAPPKFDGSDCWPVAPEGLTDTTDIASTKTAFPTGAVTANHWDSGPSGGVLRLLISVEGFDIHLDLHEPRLAMTLDPDHAGAQLGQLGGVVATAQLQTEVKKIAGSFDPSLCSGATITSILDQIGQASDILVNGTQDPAKTCDGISIGIGFKASAVSLGGVGPATPVEPDPCAP